MDKQKVLVYGEIRDYQLAELRKAVPEVEWLHAAGPEETRALAPQADILLPMFRQDLEEILARATKLRWVHSYAAGVEGLLPLLANRPDIVLTNSAGVHAPPIAEHVMALVYAFARNLPTLLAQQARREWRRPIHTFEVHGLTMGILGLGGIGGAIAHLARAAGMRVIGTRRHPRPMDEAEKVYGPDDTGQVIRESDFVVIALPLTEETRHSIGATELGWMKPEAYLINIARGAIVDEPALVAALREGRLRGAGLDVFEEEPLPAESPLWGMPNVVISPHVAAGTPRSRERVSQFFVSNLRRWLSGEPLENVVCQRAGY
ncbi:MAG: D-2-hydroxyacid dehydrogenase [Bacillota bacterium]